MSENTLYNIDRPCAHSDWPKTHVLEKEIEKLFFSTLFLTEVHLKMYYAI